MDPSSVSGPVSEARPGGHLLFRNIMSLINEDKPQLVPDIQDMLAFNSNHLTSTSRWPSTCQGRRCPFISEFCSLCSLAYKLSRIVACPVIWQTIIMKSGATLCEFTFEYKLTPFFNKCHANRGWAYPWEITIIMGIDYHTKAPKSIAKHVTFHSLSDAVLSGEFNDHVMGPDNDDPIQLFSFTMTVVYKQ